jgi:hypothetical protein
MRLSLRARARVRVCGCVLVFVFECECACVCARCFACGWQEMRLLRDELSSLRIRVKTYSKLVQATPRAHTRARLAHSAAVQRGGAAVHPGLPRRSTARRCRRWRSSCRAPCPGTRPPACPCVCARCARAAARACACVCASASVCVCARARRALCPGTHSVACTPPLTYFCYHRLSSLCFAVRPVPVRCAGTARCACAGFLCSGSWRHHSVGAAGSWTAPLSPRGCAPPELQRHASVG